MTLTRDEGGEYLLTPSLFYPIFFLDPGPSHKRFFPPLSLLPTSTEIPNKGNRKNKNIAKLKTLVI